MVVMFHRTAMNILIRESLNPCSKGKQRAGLLVASGYNISSTPSKCIFILCVFIKGILFNRLDALTPTPQATALSQAEGSLSDMHILSERCVTASSCLGPLDSTSALVGGTPPLPKKAQKSVQSMELNGPQKDVFTVWTKMRNLNFDLFYIPRSMGVM